MSEIRVLLLTDVVDSTRLTEALGDEAAAALWAAHDRAARDLLTPWRGLEIDKTDGMLLLFEQAADAVHYALAYHAALAALPLPLQARAGMHLGPVTLRENSPFDIARGAKPLEVDGVAKPTAARMMSLARGGQLLLTAQAAAALGEPLPADWQLRSHGHWDVKGLAAPLEVVELSAGPSAHAAPEDTDKVFRVVRDLQGWVPVREIPNNLPQAVTSFVGREAECADVEVLLGQARLVSLLGMGGLGKTRLALQVARAVRETSPDGVWFIDLSPIRDPALVAAETAQVLGVRDEPERPLLQTLCAHLKPRRVLLVLDNCEHLLQAAADLAHALLRAAPRLRIIATSREALHVHGETAYPVPPLPLPARASSAAVLLQSTAARLFVERAQAHKPAFVLGDAEAPAVAELVARLEGIPLALELAAARVRVLSVAEINQRLSHRYKLLTGGSRSLQQRQQTLRALVDWSYDMLGAAEQTLLLRLSVFVGGFDLDAVERVCGDEPLAADEMLDGLASLVEKSLVMAESRPDTTRYRMLETIRDYAAEKLAATGSGAATAQRHVEHFFALAKQAREGLKGAGQALWIDRLEADLDNVRAAIRLALDGGTDAVFAVKFAVALQGFWIRRGYINEGREVVRAALALPAVQTQDKPHAFALYVGAALAGNQGDHLQAREMLESCLLLRRRLEAPVEIAATLSTLALALLDGGDAAAAAICEHEALDLFTSLDYQVGVAISLIHLGQCAIAQGDDARATSFLAQGLALARKLVNHEAEAECELLLGTIDFDAAALMTSRGHFERSLAICCSAGDKRGGACATRWLGKAVLAAGDTVAATPLLAQALRDFRAFEMRAELLGCLEDHAQLAGAGGDPQAAARLAAAVATLRERLALGRTPRASQRWQVWVEGLREGLGATAFDLASAEGRAWELEQALAQALRAA